MEGRTYQGAWYNIFIRAVQLRKAATFSSFLNFADQAHWLGFPRWQPLLVPAF